MDFSISVVSPNGTVVSVERRLPVKNSPVSINYENIDNFNETSLERSALDSTTSHFCHIIHVSILWSLNK